MLPRQTTCLNIYFLHFLHWDNRKYLLAFMERSFTGASSFCEITASTLDLPKHILVPRAAHVLLCCWQGSLVPSLGKGDAAWLGVPAGLPWCGGTACPKPWRGGGIEGVQGRLETWALSGYWLWEVSTAITQPQFWLKTF